MTMKDEWVAAALTDDSVVVELLFRLKQSPSTSRFSPPPPPVKSSLPPSLPLPPQRWGHRQPRTKPANAVRFAAANVAHRYSPTTPLSWSGGGGSTSLSDESSRSSSDPSSALRSKGAVAHESTSFSNINNKVSRTNKTLAELKEEEGLLQEERIHLKRDLASLQANFEKQRARGDNLKKIKLGLNQQSAKNIPASSSAREPAISSQLHLAEASTAVSIPQPSNDELVSSSSCVAQTSTAENPKRPFVLPDLNMLPAEDEIVL